jgi:arylsulfatase A-like enzyme
MRLLTLLAATLLTAAAATAADPAKRPNVVVIFTDDHAYQALSAYGHPAKLLDTPNMDRIAAGGMRFDRCLVPNSICGPSRATVLTGKYSHINGFYNNTNNRFDGSQPTFPKMLQAAGYQTAVIGKWHLESDPTGFDYWNILPGQGASYNWLKRRDKSKPFLLMCQHKAPHRSWEPALRHLGFDNDRKYPEPATLFDDYAGRGSAEHNQDMTIAKTMAAFDLKLVTPGRLTPEQKAKWDAYYGPRNEKFRAAELTGKDLVRWKFQRYMHDYLACVKGVDEGVGKVLDTLDSEGVADNTVVIYAADQGFYLGEHGWFDKRWIFEESLRTPFLVKWPGVAKPGTVNADMVSNLDFAPTILQAAGLPVPAAIQGKSLVPILKGETPADWRKSFYYQYYEYPGPHSVARHYGVVTDRYKLVHFYDPSDYWELFDLKSDPQELTSVYGKAEYAAVTAELTAELKRLRAELKVPATDPPASMIPRPKPKAANKK